MNIWKHKYPQSIWAKEIVKILKSSSSYTAGTIVDAPCGNGIIGRLVYNEFDNLKVLLLDNDQSLLSSPYASTKDLEIKIDDIFDFKIEGENNTWLLINSLYCLPNSDKLLADKMKNYKYIIAVFPNIKRFNYKYFILKNPSFQNPSAKDITSTINLFKQHGYILETQKEITRVPFHNWNSILNRFKLPFVLKNIIYLTFDYLLFFLPGHYTIIAFKRSE